MKSLVWVWSLSLFFTYIINFFYFFMDDRPVVCSSMDSQPIVCSSVFLTGFGKECVVEEVVHLGAGDQVTYLNKKAMWLTIS